PLATVVAGLMVVSILISTAGTHGRIRFLHRPAVTAHSPLDLIREVVATLSNHNFAVAVIAGMIAATYGSLSAGLIVYFSTYFWALPSTNILVLILVGMTSTPIAVVVAPLLSLRFGKRNACMALFFASVIAANGPIVLRLLGWFPPNGSP